VADIEANGSGSKAVHTENLLVEAFAFDANAHNDTKAIGQLFVSANNGGVSIGSVDVLASANQTFGTACAAAVASAGAAIIANGVASAEGGVSVVAIAQDPGGSAANASANLLFAGNEVFIGSGNRTFHIPNSGGTTTAASANFGVFVAAVARYDGSNAINGYALADANAQVLANGNIDIQGAADVLAFAFDNGGHSANAAAGLFV